MIRDMELREEGKAEARLQSIKNLMQTMNLTAQQAMDALLIPPLEQKYYLEKL